MTKNSSFYRWEARQIPRVKVAKVDLSAARKEQTPYMPEIPDIPMCLPDLRASKQWEDAFLTHFSETRLVIYLLFFLFKHLTFLMKSASILKHVNHMFVKWCLLSH